MKYILRLSLFIIITLNAFSVKAQFTYIESDYTYSYISLNGSEDDYYTPILNQFNININILHRPIRRFGIGLKVEIPVYQKLSDFEYTESDYSYNYNQISPSIIDYDIKSKLNLTFLGRIYISTEMPTFYVDFRYTRLRFEETFSYLNYANSPKSIQKVGDRSTSGYGFGLGYKKDVSDHFYVKYEYSFDSFQFEKETSFIVIPSDPNEDSYKSPFKGRNNRNSFIIGVGYLF